ncbi:MAG: chromosome segregation SMC family protein [Nanoarchaeota archaeon]
MSFIKRLVMHGFKSFPRKTEIPFTPGINVILGPNGSGKSNVSDALCFVLGRLSIKSMRAAKAENLIFLGTKDASPAKDASVEIVFDNSAKIFSIEGDELAIKRIVRRTGQSIYKINGETKTRQEVITLLSQAGIDPNGFNIILQGEIQNFVRMQPVERRGVLEEVSGISSYESRKEKALHELEKTEERLKEVSSILRERTSYLNNLEKERQQALRFKKLEADSRKFKASIINNDLVKKKKEAERINSDIEDERKETEKIRRGISEIEFQITSHKSKVDELNLTMQKSTGLEQEKLNKEIADLRANLAGMEVNLKNQENRLLNLLKQKQDAQEQLKEMENSVKNLKNEPVTEDKTRKELNEKKKLFEKLEEQRKKFYMIKSELNSTKERVLDKTNLLQTYENESDFLLKQIEITSLEISDIKTNQLKLDKLNEHLFQLKVSLNKQSKRRIELDKNILVNKMEIENQHKIIEKISKLDICPVCKSKVTPQHLEEIRAEYSPRIEEMKKEIDSFSEEMKNLIKTYEESIKEADETKNKIWKTESDLNKISAIEDKKNQIKNLREKSEKTKAEISLLIKKKESLEKSVLEDSNVEEKYDNLNLEIQDISLRTRETVKSETGFKEREVEHLRISLKQLLREEQDVNEEFLKTKKSLEEKQKTLAEKRVQEEELSKKFQKLISEREDFQKRIRACESDILSKQHNLRTTEEKMNDMKIDKARVDAEAENFETEMLEFPGVELISGNKEMFLQRLSKIQEELSRTGTVNLKSLEVYDSIKKEYDSIKEKSETISKEKEGILKIITEIDIKKKKIFAQTLKQLNELFSRNFSELSTKGHVFLEMENQKDPFEEGSGVQIIVKTGHGKYFDVRSLSGGEQTLVALSLIFAIQEFHPYYFYILDEIDAALDKRNSERLAGLLNKYMLNGQYIVITHNDEVISRATNLYGVSMHEGISKIISLKV